MLRVRVRTRVVAHRAQVESRAEAAAESLAVGDVRAAGVAPRSSGVLREIAAEVARVELAPLRSAQRTRQRLGASCVVLTILPKTLDMNRVAAAEAAPHQRLG